MAYIDKGKLSKEEQEALAEEEPPKQEEPPPGDWGDDGDAKI